MLTDKKPVHRFHHDLNTNRYFIYRLKPPVLTIEYFPSTREGMILNSPGDITREKKESLLKKAVAFARNKLQ